MIMLKKTNGNMYEFITHTWNTVAGKCPHDCKYCYANNQVPDVVKSYNNHNPDSPVLTGSICKSDKIIIANDKSYKCQQLNLF